MPDINNIIGSIDRAMWRIRDRAINNITPFTYRDGLTYLELLERMRESVVDTIEFVSKFGDDQDKIIKQMNTTVQTFINNIESKHNEWSNDINARKAEVASEIAEFKGKLLAAAFTPILDNNYIEAPTLSPGVKVSVPTRKLFDTANTAISDIKNNKIPELNRNIYDRYTKQQSDERYVRVNEKSHGIIIGTSNAIYPWAERVLSNIGYTPHNFAVGGAAFYTGWDSPFQVQLQRAKSDAEKKGYMDKVGVVFFVDMLNDIRLKRAIYTEASTCANFIRSNWPTARVISVPVIFNQSTNNMEFGYAPSMGQRIQEFKKAFSLMKPEVCEASRTWFWEGNDVGANWIKGANEVHLTDAGYDKAERLTTAWLNGDDGWVNYGWTPLSNFGDNEYANLSDFYVKREGVNVSLTGSFSLKKAVTEINTVVAKLPSWAMPLGEAFFTYFDGYKDVKHMTVQKTPALMSLSTLKTGTLMLPNFTYPLF